MCLNHQNTSVGLVDTMRSQGLHHPSYRLDLKDKFENGRIVILYDNVCIKVAFISLDLNAFKFV